jgi:hypothetical protein
VSGRCARPRGKEWRRGGRLELTANGGDLDQQWRRDGLWHEQPSGVLTRVLERESVREEGVYKGAMAWARGKRSHRNEEGFSKIFQGSPCSSRTPWEG